MIRLTDKQYEAIGRVAVQSGTLDRELGEYLFRLSVPRYKPDLPLGKKREQLKAFIESQPITSGALADFAFVLTKVEALVDRRNAVTHGAWSDVANAPTRLGEVTVLGKKAALHAREVEEVASKLRIARKLLLRLMHDHFSVAAAHKKCPQRSATELKSLL